MIYSGTRPLPRRIDPLLIGLGLTVVVFLVARSWRLDAWMYYGAALLWLLALGVVLLRWTNPRRAGRAIKQLSSDRRLLTHCLVLFLLALVLRVVALDRVPANLGGDEFSQALEAKAFVEGRLRSMFGTSDWYGVPLLYPWLGSFYFRVFGMEPWAWRLFTALAGSITVPLLYLLVRAQFASVGLALAAGGLLTFNHLHVYFSRLGSNQGFDALFTTTVLLALVLARRHQERGMWWYVAGVVAGLGFYFYFALRGIAALCLVIVLIWAWQRQAPRLRAPLWYVTGLAMAAAPLLGRPPGQVTSINDRVFQVLDLPGGEDGSTVVQLLSRTTIALRSIQGLGLRGWYESGAGVLVTRLELVMLVIGIVIALRRTRDAGWIHPFLLTGILAAVALFTENPVMSQRVTAVSVPAAVLVTLGADHFARLLWPRWRTDVALALVALIAGLNVFHLFFFHLPRRNVDVTGLVATELARRLSSEGQIRQLVFCGGTQMFWDSNSSLRFQLPRLRGRSVDPDWTVPDDPAIPDTAYVVLDQCSDVRYELELRPTMVGEELRYRPVGTGEALQMYRDTGGLGYLRWVPIDEVVPYRSGEQLIMTVFTARPPGDR